MNRFIRDTAVGVAVLVVIGYAIVRFVAADAARMLADTLADTAVLR